ncbi:MAG: hypothetical protein O9309_10345 [Rhizobium sp.]|nr:hypothetical protein [Rhizobium sp.]MCZ8348998.1 hypothetical protein [Rhizobium sp.]
MPFNMQLISNHGSTNPIVARLTLQTFELLKWIEISDAQQNRLTGLMHQTHLRLLRCYDHAYRIKLAERDQLEHWQASGPINPKKLPYVIDLEADVEGFLMTATQYLRDLVPVFNTLWGASLKPEARRFWRMRSQSSEAEKWSIKTLGPDHPLVPFLQANEPWIAELIKRRNAVEHREDGRDRLVIDNFRALGPTIAPPAWGRETQARKAVMSPIVAGMEELLSLLLSFGEELFVIAVMARPRWKHVVVREIPEEMRNPNCPIRFITTLDEEMAKHLTEAASRTN